MSDATWVTLGTCGGPPIHAEQAQIANALVVGPPGDEQRVYLFDVGNGVLRPMDAAGLRARSVAVADLNEPTLVYDDGTIRVSAITVDHYQAPPAVPLHVRPVALAYRVEAGGRTFVYTGDTGPCDAVITLARGADILITEVVDVAAIERALTQMLRNAPEGVLAGLVANMGCCHLSPDEIGRIAAEAGVGRVVLTHYVPSLAEAPDARGWTAGITAVYDGSVTMSRDLDRF